MADGAILVATTSAVITAGGRNLTITKGMTAREGAAILKTHRYLFAPLVPDFEAEEPPAPRKPAARKDAAQEPAGP